MRGRPSNSTQTPWFSLPGFGRGDSYRRIRPVLAQSQRDGKTLRWSGPGWLVVFYSLSAGLSRIFPFSLPSASLVFFSLAPPGGPKDPVYAAWCQRMRASPHRTLISYQRIPPALALDASRKIIRGSGDVEHEKTPPAGLCPLRARFTVANACGLPFPCSHRHQRIDAMSDPSGRRPRACGPFPLGPGLVG